MAKQTQKTPKRTRRTFPVTVTHFTPVTRPLTAAERWDRIHNGQAWDQTVTRAGGGKF